MKQPCRIVILPLICDALVVTNDGVSPTAGITLLKLDLFSYPVHIARFIYHRVCLCITYSYWLMKGQDESMDFVLLQVKQAASLMPGSYEE
jgi:hypothetical protein